MGVVFGFNSENRLSILRNLANKQTGVDENVTSFAGEKNTGLIKQETDLITCISGGIAKK